MPHTEAETLAAKLSDPELFTRGELTRLADLWDVKLRDLLIALENRSTDTTSPFLSVTYKRAGEITGWSERTIQYAVSNGLLASRGEKKKVIPVKALNAWVEAGCPTKLGGGNK